MIREILSPSRSAKGFLSLALKIAEASECSQKHGAVIVKGGRVLSIGLNKNRNDPRFVETDSLPGFRGTIFTTHAERDALSRVKDARGSILYVARISRTGKPAFSQPCSQCAQALIKAGIKAISYTTGLESA